MRRNSFVQLPLFGGDLPSVQTPSAEVLTSAPTRILSWNAKVLVLRYMPCIWNQTECGGNQHFFDKRIALSTMVSATLRDRLGCADLLSGAQGTISLLADRYGVAECSPIFVGENHVSPVCR